MNKKLLAFIILILIIFSSRITFAQRRIHQLNEMTQTSNDDLLVIVDDPEGIPVEKKIKMSNFTQFNDISIDTNSIDPNNMYFLLSDKFVICKTFTSAGINACIDALGSESGEVYLPEDTYACTEEITIDYANTTLRGAGEGTILRIDANGFDGITINQKDGTLISNLKIDGNEDNIDAKSTDSLISITGNKHNTKIENCILSNYDNIGIDCTIATPGGGIIIDNCIFKDSETANSQAIRVQSYSGIIISENVFSDIEHGIIYNSPDSSKLQIINNWFYSCDDTAIEINATGALISGNGFHSNTGMDMDINDMFTIIIGNNSYWNNNGDAAVRIDGSGRCTFSNNVFEGKKWTEILEVTSNYNSIIGNVFDEAGTSGSDKAIKLDTANNNTITNNSWNADNYGIYLVASDHNLISGNIGAMTSGTYDIYVDSDSNANIIYGNKFPDGMNLNANSGDYEIYGVPNYYGSTSTSGTLKQWTYQNDNIADDGTVSLPDATSGMIFACITDPNEVFADASGFWMISHDGACTLVSGTSGTTAAADTDGDLCIYDGGTYGILKNRMGNVGEIRAFYFYN